LTVEREVKNGELEINQVCNCLERSKVQVDSGAIDTMAPPDIAAPNVFMKPRMSEAGVGFEATNGSKIESFGEMQVVGYTDEGDSVGIRITVQMSQGSWERAQDEHWGQPLGAGWSEVSK
jgi:hypothetical protein